MNEEDPLKTPSSKRSNITNECLCLSSPSVHCKDVCSICLSPFLKEKETDVIETVCMHIFHRSCLGTAKLWKSECPMCRTALSPVISSSSINQNDSFQQRQAIVQAATRGQNAVRIAMARSRILETESSPFVNSVFAT